MKIVVGKAVEDMFYGKVSISLVCIITAFSLITSAVPFPVIAEENVKTQTDDILYESKMTYREYLQKHSSEKVPESPAVLMGIKCNDDSITFSADISEDGMYCAEICYTAYDTNDADIEFVLTIDGRVPFDSAERLRLNKVYTNEKTVQKDKNGNEIRPAQVQSEIQQKTDIKDPDGLYSEPLQFFFEKGSHTVTLNIQRGSIKVEYIKLHGMKRYRTYDEYISSVNDTATPGETPDTVVRIEGEEAKYKSDSGLYPTYDNSSCDVSPSDPWHILYNTIGKGSFKKSGQNLTWEISVPNDGWYKIGIKARQEEMRGFFSNRRIYIDGEVPCEDMSEVRFYYSTDFELTELKTKDNGELYIYLTSGETHTLTMEAVPGAIGSYIQELDDVVYKLSDIYRSIVMITSPEPDKYTDYYVHEKIPGLIESLDSMAMELREIQKEIETLSGFKGSEAASLENMAVILEKCIDSPLRIPSYLSQIKNCTAALSSWIRDYRDQPLEIDYIELAAKNSSFSDCEAGFFKKISYSFQRFLASFREEDDSLGESGDGKEIEVWVQIGRDQAQVVKELTASEFIPEYGTAVSVKLVSGGIVEASLADKGPDVVLFLSGENPVNLGSRGLLADVSELDGFDELSSLYSDDAFVPYTYEGSVYGVPLTRSWAMMFYRKDILSSLGFDAPPETWQELIDMLPEFQRNYMSVGLVLPGMQSAPISPATETGHTFAAMMLQRGLNYYNDSCTKTTFDTNEAAEVFDTWTSLYTKYSLLQQYDPFSRFRTGDYPIVVADYTFANQLIAAAPEIKGLWDFTAVPGTERSDGSISHAVNSIGSGAVIFNNKDDEIIEKSWEFVRWFSSTEVQTKYAQQTEALMGQLGRYAPANTETLEHLSWSAKELQTIEASMSELQEIPIIPSSYAVTRNIMNAFRDVVNNGSNPRETLMYYNSDINKEISRRNRHTEN
jgi:ABC-type glycerol-3-phosphate transport system substrate-binding protein